MSQPIKAILTQESLDFALAHISHYYDTDFFPRTEEFLALSYHWDEVRKHLLESDLDQILSAAPIAEAWPKTKGGYALTVQLVELLRGSGILLNSAFPYSSVGGSAAMLREGGTRGPGVSQPDACVG